MDEAIKQLSFHKRKAAAVFKDVGITVIRGVILEIKRF